MSYSRSALGPTPSSGPERNPGRRRHAQEETPLQPRSIDPPHLAEELDRLIEETCDSKLADKAEDARDKIDEAAEKLAKDPPDRQATAGGIEGAIGDLAAAVDDGCFEPEHGVGIMDDLLGVSRELAVEALDVASDRGKRDEIHEAEKFLAKGDSARRQGRRGSLDAFKDAAKWYKDALAKSESAMG
jgi:hypothetical protein